MSARPSAHREAQTLPLTAVLATISACPRPVVERLVAGLIDYLDQQDGDPDSEPNGDLEGIDEREPDYDAEIETWSHWMDHPAELYIGKRPGWTDQPV